MYLILETADVEVIGTHLFYNKDKANKRFERITAESGEFMLEYGPKDMMLQTPAGTLRLAGDDSYAVQLVEISPVDCEHDWDMENESCTFGCNHVVNEDTGFCPECKDHSNNSVVCKKCDAIGDIINGGITVS